MSSDAITLTHVLLLSANIREHTFEYELSGEGGGVISEVSQSF